MNRSISGFFWGACISLLVVLTVRTLFGAGRETEQEAQQRGATILAAAAEAAGGGALAKVESLELNTRREAHFAGHSRGQSDVDLRLIYPLQMRLEVKVMETQTVGGYASSGSGPITSIRPTEHSVFAYAEGSDGNIWWRKTPQNIEERPADNGMQLRVDLVGALGLYRRAAEGKLQAKFSGELQFQGRPVQVLVISEGGTRLYLDPQTHLLVGAAYPVTTGEGIFDAFRWWADFMKVSFQSGGQEQSIWWSQYRRVKFKSGGKEEAVQFPYLWTSHLDGTRFLEEKVVSLKVNGKQNPKIFARPK